KNFIKKNHMFRIDELFINNPRISDNTLNKASYTIMCVISKLYSTHQSTSAVLLEKVMKSIYNFDKIVDSYFTAKIRDSNCVEYYYNDGVVKKGATNINVDFIVDFS